VKRLSLLLVAIGAAGFALSSPYLLRVLRASPLRLPEAALLALQFAETLLLVAVAAYGGARLCGTAGLDAPRLRAIAERRERPPDFASMVIEALAAGSVAAIAARAIVPLSVWQPVQAGFWTRTCAAFHGATVEEILLRWGLLTALMVLFRRTGIPGFWPANLLAALALGALHLPVLRLSAAPISAGGVFAFLAGNAVLGLTFGWLYRRRGLEAAMFAHGAADVWLQGLLPALLA